MWSTYRKTAEVGTDLMDKIFAIVTLTPSESFK